MIQGRKRNASRRGYLLITVVVMIAVATMMLSRIATASLRVASLANTEERDMRSRWAATSLRHYALDTATRMIAATRDPRTGAKQEATVWRNIDLAGHRWRIVVSDESAKVNLLHAADQFDRQRTESLVNELVTGRSGLTSLSGSAVAPVGGRRWENWLRSSTGMQTLAPEAIASATRRITLWGDGRLNLQTAEPDTIDALWKRLFGRNAPAAVHEASERASSSANLPELEMLGLRETQLETYRAWFSNQRQCYSVWTFCLTDDRVSPILFVEWGENITRREHRGYEY